MMAAVSVVAACAGPPADTHGPWTAAEALQPADLVATLKGGGPKPAIVYVGFKVLFHPGHIPGATLHGPSAEPEGMADLRKWASSQPKDAPVVIYCGCCPFDDCPNVVPAYDALRELGFTKIRVLILPTNFEADWVEKGYPIER
jgi:thiosulfate/3-mercaptopyruvate sulfurtransferase